VRFRYVQLKNDNMTPFTDRIRNLISDNYIDKVFIELSIGLRTNHSELFNNLILLQSRYNEIKRQEILGLLDFNTLSIHKTKIISAIIGIVKEIEMDNSLINNMINSIKGNLSDNYFSISIIPISLNPLDIFTYEISQLNCFQVLLNQIYTLIKDYVPPHSYEKQWIINEIETNFKITKPKSDNSISLQSIGILSGKRYETIKL